MTERHFTAGGNGWPKLPSLQEWQDTCTTLHMWTQVAGKIRLGLSPDVNHCWGSTLYVSTRGLTTSPIPYGSFTFAIDFDFIAHALRISTSEGAERSFALQPMTVAEFYRKTMQAFGELGIEVKIFTRPVEVEVAIPFEKDEQHSSYDAYAVTRFWHALVQADRVFKDFRARFIGKVSPVHFFWGGFDLAVTRFSGRTAPKHPGGAPNVAVRIMEEAYSHEVASAGFWSGTGLGETAFYAYAYPVPEGFNKYPVQPEAVFYHDKLGLFILPYEAVRTAENPDGTLLSFLQTTYEAAATLANWDRRALERNIMHT
ncbi:DUF5996 family protein [Nitrosovibrio tenuis]|uniref:Ava_C0101 and related proteins n=1 Tax=Nitrosovibrio tenuis TaxID=1233 RepID=A0A1H7ID08_9PROT|nr:DUF5996 family protein [Nitrosovibrio tenuis]SEK58495.1 hypothetical protein SAMN05216387_10284 [Nitrosovibrio tenuis]